MFKSQFQLEGYLFRVKVAKYCIALKLGVSCYQCHKLCSIPPDLERLDKLCHCMEDEIHFLCVCPAYCNLRDELYSIIYNLYIQVSDTSPLQIKLHNKYLIDL